MKKTDIKITRYESGSFWVDIIELPDTYEAWLSNKSYGVNDMMFGGFKTDSTLAEFIDLVEKNLDDYKEMCGYDSMD